jgi:hypothetical protein
VRGLVPLDDQVVENELPRVFFVTYWPLRRGKPSISPYSRLNNLSCAQDVVLGDCCLDALSCNNDTTHLDPRVQGLRSHQSTTEEESGVKIWHNALTGVVQVVL